MSNFHYIVTEEFVEFMAKAHAEHPDNSLIEFLSKAEVGNLVYTHPPEK